MQLGDLGHNHHRDIESDLYHVSIAVGKNHAVSTQTSNMNGMLRDHASSNYFLINEDSVENRGNLRVNNGIHLTKEVYMSSARI
jgi:hypothetical protein